MDFDVSSSVNSAKRCTQCAKNWNKQDSLLLIQAYAEVERTKLCMFLTLLYIYYFLISGSEARQVSDKRIAEIFNASSPSETRPESGCSYRLFQMQQTHKFDPLRQD